VTTHLDVVPRVSIRGVVPTLRHIPPWLVQGLESCVNVQGRFQLLTGVGVNIRCVVMPPCPEDGCTGPLYNGDRHS
jgi:hypothetical protein